MFGILMLRQMRSAGPPSQVEPREHRVESMFTILMLRQVRSAGPPSQVELRKHGVESMFAILTLYRCVQLVHQVKLSCANMELNPCSLS
jgi:Rod binding domain-containing protein